MNQRLEDIETKIAFLEQANTQLGDVVYRQQQELDALRARLVALVERLETTQGSSTTYTAEDEKPPHY